MVPTCLESWWSRNLTAERERLRYDRPDFFRRSSIPSVPNTRSNDKHAIKRSLQRLCELHRLGQRPAYLDRRALENMLLGRLEVFKQDAKIVRWCLNLLAFVGTNASTDSIVRAASLHSGDSKIVAAAVSALCSIHKFDGSLGSN